MPTGYPNRGRKLKYLEARRYLGVRRLTMEKLIATGCLRPDGKFPTGERFWYIDTLDKSPIKGLNYTQSGQ